jgi:hypothetical protein
MNIAYLNFNNINKIIIQLPKQDTSYEYFDKDRIIVTPRKCFFIKLSSAVKVLPSGWYTDDYLYPSNDWGESTSEEPTFYSIEDSYGKYKKLSSNKFIEDDKVYEKGIIYIYTNNKYPEEIRLNKLNEPVLTKLETILEKYPQIEKLIN